MKVDDKPTGLKHIQDGHLRDNVFNEHCVSWGVGPLNISACIDITVPSATVKVDLVGVSIGNCTLSPQHTECLIGGSVAGFKAEVTLKLVDNCSLVATAELCIPFKGCQKYTHTLYSWC